MVFATTTTTTTITTSREVAFFSLSLSLSRRRRRRRLLRPPGEVATISFFVGGQNCEKFNHQTKWRLFFFFIPFAFIQTHYTHTHPQRADVRREYPLADRSLSLSLYIYIWCVVVSLLSLFLFLEIKNFPLSLCSCCVLFRNDDDDDDDRRRVFIASRLTSTLSLFCSVSSVCDINRPGKESILFFAEFSTSARTDKPISCGRRSNTTRIDFSCRKTNTRIQLGLGFLRKARRRDRRRSSRDEGLTF